MVEIKEEHQIMPPLSREEYQALKESIKENGVQVPIELDSEGNVLDGHHRLKACKELGIEDYPKNIKAGLESEEEKRSYIRQINLARRHINQEQKEKLIKDQLKDTPKKSNRQIARKLGVDKNTVKKYRKKLEKSGEIPHFSKREDPRTGELSQPAEKRKNQETKSKEDNEEPEEESGESKEKEENEEGVTNIPVKPSESTEKAKEVAQEKKKETKPLFRGG